MGWSVNIGTIAGTAPFLLLGIVLPSAFGIDDFVFYGIVPMILIPLTFAYAIVRFQMLNVRVIVRRTFLYAATTGVLFGFYALAIWAANQLFASSRLSSSPLFTFGFFLVIIPVFEFVRRRLQTPLDKLFFREKKLVGVLMIGSPKGRKKLVEIVKSQQDIDTPAEREAILGLK